MALELFANLPSTSVSSGGTTAPAQGTTETWTVTSSASFPAAGSGTTPPTQFHVADVASNSELIAVTNVSGTTWTVTRGAEGTTPVAHAGGFTVFQVVTAGGLGNFPVFYNVRSPVFGAKGDGATDDTAAIQAALTAAGNAGIGIVYLPEGTYRTSSPLTVPSAVTFRSETRGMGSPVDSYGLGGLPVIGAILKPLSGFSGSGVVLMDNSAGVSQQGGQQIIGISIDGSALSGGNSVNGIQSIGAVAAVTLTGCMVYNVGGVGVYASLDGAFRSGNLWDVSHVTVSDCGSWGFRLPGLSDSFFTDCRTATNTGGGYLIQDQANSKYVQCHAEWNGATGIGFKIYSPSVTGYVTMTGCTSEHNGADGFQITGSHASVVMLTGCRSVADGRNNGSGGGGYAGFKATAFAGVVVGTGCVAQLTAGSTWPQYGAAQVSSSNEMALNSSYLAGQTQAAYDDGSNTKALVWTPFDTHDEHFTVGDQGFLGWAYDPAIAANASSNPAAGTIIAVRIKVPACKITNLWVGINSAGSGLTSGQNFAGLYSGDGTTLLSATADQTTNWTNTSFNYLSMALVTPQTVPAGFVYVAWYANGTTPPKFQWAGSSNHVNANLGNATARFAHGGSATTALPSSLTLTTSGDAYWAAVN